MVQINIKGVAVDFPFEPYACQVAYMQKVIECLKEGKNGVLESPTGTGKTLCLLCATLAWRSAYIASAQLKQVLTKDTDNNFGNQLKEDLQTAAGTNSAWESGSTSIPKIIYASRTHTQLSQVVSELKTTVYRPKITVLGSRDQLCIHPDVTKQETNTAKVHSCRTKVSARSCVYYNNIEAQKLNPDFSGNILDIEDMVKVGTSNKVCPYYMSRELKTNADIIFMPYNYILDAKTRAAHSVDLANTILLVDEAHNVESVCENSSSFDLTALDIASCVEECDQIMKFLQDAQSLNQEVPADLTAEDVAMMKAFFLNFEKTVSDVKLVDGKLTLPGSYIYELLNHMNITKDTKDQVLEMIDKCNTFLASQGSSSFHKRHYALQKFADILKVVFVREPDQEDVLQSKDMSKYYKVHIHEAEKPEKPKVNVWLVKKSKEERTLSYWCFNPGLTLKDIMRQGVRSLILTSGTLSPINSFKAELEVPFQIHLENPHVIDSNQIFVGVLPNGPDGRELSSSYQVRYDESYQRSLGNSICNFCKVIPHGILVFFPSYPVMDRCIQQWVQSGIWDRISQRKFPFVEPKGKGQFSQIIEDFYSAIDNPEKTGAIFFAVCRGKVSEGLDFANKNGRAVIITGLPFPPKADARVQLKMGYLNQARSKGTVMKLNGNTWYRQQASRAVNQAVGRVIRHRRDYGAILLLDRRFSSKDSISELPKWMRGNVRVFRRFGDMQRETAGFFKRIQLSTELTAMRENQVKERTQQTHSTNAMQNTVMDEPKQITRVAFTSIKPANPRTTATPPTNRKDFNKEATHSLAKLKANDKSIQNKTQLLDSLAEYEARQIPVAKSCTQYENVELEKVKTVGNANHPVTAIREPEITQPKKANYRLIMPNMAQQKRHETGPEIQKKQRLANASEFLAQAKHRLDRKSQAKLVQTIQTYSQDNDISKAMCNLKDTFCFREELFDLFQDFGQFVKQRHRMAFNAACLEYERKVKGDHIVKADRAKDTAAEPSQKRCRLELSIPVQKDKPATSSSNSFSSSKVQEDNSSVQWN